MGCFSTLADVLASAEHFIDYSTDHAQGESALLRTRCWLWCWRRNSNRRPRM